MVSFSLDIHIHIYISIHIANTKHIDICIICLLSFSFKMLKMIRKFCLMLHLEMSLLNNLFALKEHYKTEFNQKILNRACLLIQFKLYKHCLIFATK